MVIRWAVSDVTGLSLQLSHFHSLPLGTAGCRWVYILVNVGQLSLAQGFDCVACVWRTFFRATLVRLRLCDILFIKGL